MSETELAFPVEIDVTEGVTPEVLIFGFHNGVVLRERYQFALEAEFAGCSETILVLAYSNRVEVTTNSKEIANDTEFREFVIGKIRSVLLRASLGS